MFKVGFAHRIHMQFLTLEEGNIELYFNLQLQVLSCGVMTYKLIFFA